METLTDILTEENIAILNVARSILKRCGNGYPDGYGAARVNTLAEHAETALFLFVNNASTWGELNLSRQQIHNYTTEEIAAMATEELVIS